MLTEWLADCLCGFVPFFGKYCIYQYTRFVNTEALVLQTINNYSYLSSYLSINVIRVMIYDIGDGFMFRIISTDILIWY